MVYQPVCRYGLEFPKQLEWRKWHPGSEYVKQLVVKNVSTKVNIPCSLKSTWSSVHLWHVPTAA